MVEGHSQHSDRVPVTSRVPQGSVLGPCLSLNYISNDLPECIGSTVRLFPEDIVMHAIANRRDSRKLQTDNLAIWDKKKWQMQYYFTQTNAKCLELPINENS